MSFCSHCGNPLPDSAKFCAACGTRVAPPAPEYQAPPVEEPVYIPPVAEPEVAEYQEPVYQEPVYQEPVYQEPVYQEPAYQEPAYQPPVPAPEKPKKIQKFQKKPRGVLKTLLVIFLCVLTFIFATATVISLCIRSTVTAENVVELIRSVELDEIEADTIISDKGTKGSITEWLREELVKRGADWATMSTKDVEVYLETFIVPFAEEKAGEFAEVLLTGKGKASITTEDIRELLMDSADYLEEEHGIVLTDEMVDNLVDWVDSFGISEYASTKYLEKEYGDVLDVARMCLSWVAVAVFGLLTLVFLVLIWVVNKCWIRNLNVTGILATAVGGMFSACVGLNLVAPGLLLTICGGETIVYSLICMVMNSGTVMVLSVFGAGVALLLVKALVCSIKVTQK